MRKEVRTYPPPFNFYYPDTGNFIGFVSNLGSRELMFDMISYIPQKCRSAL